jgi:DNA-binding NarL/FixJ family response regulator
MLIAQGMSDESIANQVRLSRLTIEGHRARLMKAAGVRNGVELVVWFSERDTG